MVPEQLPGVHGPALPAGPRPDIQPCYARIGRTQTGLLTNSSRGCLGAFNFQPLGFASTAHGLARTGSLFKQHAGGFYGAFDERPRSFAQFLALLYVGNVLLHVRRRPATRMRNKRKLREIETKL